MGRSGRTPLGTRKTRTWLVVAALALTAVAIAAAVMLTFRGPPGQERWARFGTQDVHALAFVDGNPDHLLFGHHGGLRESTDGGRTWRDLPVRDDAMSLSPAADGSLVIAGHEVLVASRDGGATWAPVPNDLPSLDIHGFTRDPSNPGRMWAYVATGGLWESADFGSTWTQVLRDTILFPLAVHANGQTTLLGVDMTGLVRSTDGGRSWTPLGTPPTYPMTSLAATPDGSVVYAGSTDALYRSSDGGATWEMTGYAGSAFAIATSGDGERVAVVSRETDFFRSSDAGASWPGPG